MSRLYYPPKRDSELASGAKTELDSKDTLEKVAKLIPSEVITGYTGLISLFASAQSPQSRYAGYGIAFVLGLALTPTYLSKMAEEGEPKRNHLIVSTIAFVVWAYFTSGRQILPSLYDVVWASAALLIFTLISGAVPLNK